ncbi:hypothetical protein [Enterovibrio norvegicus]|uniref:hypothetical protein n=1 Tax=Enterovibrio norvegicus TaxID=188144 RepID=UPI00352DC682
MLFLYSKGMLLLALWFDVCEFRTLYRFFFKQAAPIPEAQFELGLQSLTQSNKHYDVETGLSLIDAATLGGHCDAITFKKSMLMLWTDSHSLAQQRQTLLDELNRLRLSPHLHIVELLAIRACGLYFTALLVVVLALILREIVGS